MLKEQAALLRQMLLDHEKKYQFQLTDMRSKYKQRYKERYEKIFKTEKEKLMGVISQLKQDVDRVQELFNKQVNQVSKFKQEMNRKENEYKAKLLYQQQIIEQLQRESQL